MCKYICEKNLSEGVKEALGDFFNKFDNNDKDEYTGRLDTWNTWENVFKDALDRNVKLERHILKSCDKYYQKKFLKDRDFLETLKEAEEVTKEKYSFSVLARFEEMLKKYYCDGPDSQLDLRYMLVELFRTRPKPFDCDGLDSVFDVVPRSILLALIKRKIKYKKSLVDEVYADGRKPLEFLARIGDYCDDPRSRKYYDRKFFLEAHLGEIVRVANREKRRKIIFQRVKGAIDIFKKYKANFRAKNDDGFIAYDMVMTREKCIASVDYKKRCNYYLECFGYERVPDEEASPAYKALFDPKRQNIKKLDNNSIV